MLDIIVPIPLYDMQQTFTYNMMKGPQFYELPVFRLSVQTEQYHLFGYPLKSPIGVPACALMTSKGISLMAKLGFDVLTYKTIRSSACAGHPMPNMCYICCDKQLTASEIGVACQQTDRPPASVETIAISNSFGIGCLALDEMAVDISKARGALSDGQILIVSVLGVESEKRSIAQDFAFTASVAVSAGAHIIEANLSCPNVACSAEPMYKNPTLVYDICAAIVQAIKPIPVIVKMGIFDDEEQMRATLRAAAAGGVQGICGINSVPVRVVNQNNNPFFGTREVSGVSGNPIRSLALNFVKTAKCIIDEEKLNLVILATGGITRAEYFDEFLDAGATIVLSAAGTMFDPFLALRYHKVKLKK